MMANAWRSQKTVGIAEALRSFRAKACRLATGKNLAEWEQLFAERRTVGIQRNHLNSDRIFYPWSNADKRFDTYYGLPKSAWELVVMKVDPLHDLPEHFQEAVDMDSMPLIIARKDHMRDIHTHLYGKSKYHEYEMPKWLLVKRIRKQYLQTI